MKNQQINIRDPFVVVVDGKYYMYGTRAANFGQGTGGFDVYVGDDLENWSEPKEVFSSEKYGMNTHVNWAPEVHFYKGFYYAGINATEYEKQHTLRVARMGFEDNTENEDYNSLIFDVLAKDFYRQFAISEDSKGEKPYN